MIPRVPLGEFRWVCMHWSCRNSHFSPSVKEFWCPIPGSPAPHSCDETGKDGLLVPASHSLLVPHTSFSLCFCRSLELRQPMAHSVCSSSALLATLSHVPGCLRADAGQGLDPQRSGGQHDRQESEPRQESQDPGVH